MVSSDQDETGSSRSNKPHSFSGASRNDSYGELSGTFNKPMSSNLNIIFGEKMPITSYRNIETPKYLQVTIQGPQTQE